MPLVCCAENPLTSKRRCIPLLVRLAGHLATRWQMPDMPASSRLDQRAPRRSHGSTYLLHGTPGPRGEGAGITAATTGHMVPLYWSRRDQNMTRASRPGFLGLCLVGAPFWRPGPLFPRRILDGRQDLRRSEEERSAGFRRDAVRQVEPSPARGRDRGLVHRTRETHSVWPALAVDPGVVSPRQITKMPVSRRLDLVRDHPPSHDAFHGYGEPVP